ncbi:hypothetical protein GCM10025868_34150 [Angustibacter aerolatus]|uniref:Uncharacterized protein n=1 Tax=Angustibacter aerolatus TaxID=1162965 RepID=A0ABQ6JN26_9ACTN|nr:hypothetical protein GCM10025868_34150 [Angustibacter aerolatus]
MAAEAVLGPERGTRRRRRPVTEPEPFPRNGSEVADAVVARAVEVDHGGAVGLLGHRAALGRVADDGARGERRPDRAVARQHPALVADCT